jgi:hypothetical protein
METGGERTFQMGGGDATIYPFPSSDIFSEVMFSVCVSTLSVCLFSAVPQNADKFSALDRKIMVS